MKSIYICGDSFSSPDPEYGPCWVDFLQQDMSGRAQVVNHSSVSASNLLISIQVSHAIAKRADFVVVQGTACTRSEASVSDSVDQDLLNRFLNYELVSFSILRPYRSHLNTTQQNQITQYHKHFFDLPLAIYRDQCIIENTLQRLEDSGIPFLFDQGGFEHPSFGDVSSTKYFSKFEHRRSAFNLWDHGDTKDERPYYHVKDTAKHRQVADYYVKKIEPYL